MLMNANRSQLCATSYVKILMARIFAHVNKVLKGLTQTWKAGLVKVSTTYLQNVENMTFVSCVYCLSGNSPKTKQNKKTLFADVSLNLFYFSLQMLTNALYQSPYANALSRHRPVVQHVKIHPVHISVYVQKVTN